MPRFVLCLVALAACTDPAAPSTGDTGDLPALLDRHDLADAAAFPESVAFDPEGRTFYTSSLGNGDLTAIAADGTESVFFAGTGAPGTATVGLEIDPTNRRLWACAIRVDGSEPGALWVFDLDTGDALATISLAGASSGASCTDVAFDGAGVAYVTDRENAAIYRVDLDGAPTVWSDAPALAPELIGSNGIAFTPDGQFLLVSKYLGASLVRIRVADPTDVETVALGGDAFSGGESLHGADDAVFFDDALYVTLVDRLARVVPDDETWTRATVTTSPLVDGGVTGLTVAEGRLYGANGQAVPFTLSQPPALPFWIRRLAP